MILLKTITMSNLFGKPSYQFGQHNTYFLYHSACLLDGYLLE